jgi:hypothetical protein
MVDTSRRPLVPEDLVRNGAAKSRSVARMLAAVALSSLLKEPAIKIAERNWPNDSMAATLTRAAVTPTTAASVPTVGKFSFLSGLAPQSAATRLFAICQRVDMAGVYQLSVPAATTSPQPIFVAEGSPFPMSQAVIGLPTLIGPVKKMMLGTAVTSELEFATPETASVIISRLLSEQAGKSLDAVLFDNVAASSARPAGLLNGVSPIGATAGGGLAAIAGDLANIADDIATAGGNTDGIVFVANPRQAIVLRLLASPTFNYTIIGSSALADGTIVGIAPDAIVSGYDGVPEIDVSKYGTAHFEDTTPLPLVDGSSTVAPGVRSAWQSDTLFLRLRLKCCWGPLATGMVQVVNSVTW